MEALKRMEIPLHWWIGSAKALVQKGLTLKLFAQPFLNINPSAVHPAESVRQSANTNAVLMTMQNRF